MAADNQGEKTPRMKKLAHKARYIISLCLLLAGLQQTATAAAPTDGTSSSASPVLTIGVVEDPPYLIKEQGGEWTGLNADIWKAVSQELKVDYLFKEITFGEMLEALKTGSIDLSIEAIFVTSERENVMDLSFPFGNTRLALATLPGKVHHPWWSAMMIFFSWGTAKVVGLLCATLCVLGFLFWCIERKHNPEHFGGGLVGGIGAGIYWVGSTLASGVCFGISLKSLPARVLGLVWMLVCAIALSALIASLTAAVTESRNTVEVVNGDMLRQMHLGGIKGSAESDVLKQLGGKYRLYAKEEDALNALLRKEIEGFLYDEITLFYHRQTDYKGRISVSPTDSRRFFFGFGFPKESPWRRKVNSAILNLMEKPDWAFLLTRHGFGADFEEKPVNMMKLKR
jgi:polar amino acid transport system substrate-binding protein